MNTAVVIPAYNAARYVGHAIESALNQEHKPAEIIVVDDGSEDDTASVAARYPVRYLRQTNRGVSLARNKGIEATKAEWIAFLDADDWWFPAKLRLQAEALKQNRAAVLCYTARMTRDSQGNEAVVPAAEHVWPSLRYRPTISTPTIVVRRDAIVQAGLFNPQMDGAEDWDMWVRLYRAFPGRFIGVPEVLVCCLVLNSGLSSRVDLLESQNDRLIESLVSDLTGLQKLIWKRRIRAVQLLSTALTARQVGSRNKELSHAVRAALTWPSPFWYSRRYKALAATVVHRVFGTAPKPPKV